MTLVVLYFFLLFVMLLGVVGSVVPALPGASLIVLAVIVWGAVTGFSGVSLALSVAVVVLLLSVAIDTLAGIWGAQRAGASRWGQIGAIVGLIVGMFGLLPALPFGGPILGVLIGPLAGAIVGELLYRRSLPFAQRFKVSFKAGLGIVLGSLIGNLIQGVLALVATVVFAISTWAQVMG